MTPAIVRPDDGVPADIDVGMVIIGAGACGLIAGLAAADAGCSPLILERDPVPSGSTALSSGYIPAAGTRHQAARGIQDNPEYFARDILAKTKQRTDPAMALRVAQASAPTLQWLEDRHFIPFVLLDDVHYPGHSVVRMHAVPERSGSALMARLSAAAAAAGIDVVPNARATTLFVDPTGRVTKLAVERPGGLIETVSCQSVVLACNGYGGNPDLISRYIPEMTAALYAGHRGNTGDALLWGQQMNAATSDLSAYQGHGSYADPPGVLITWTVMAEGGIQVNCHGERFSDESQGYSEHSSIVLRQPGGVAFAVYDARIDQFAQAFPEYRTADSLGAVRRAPDLATLAERITVPAAALEQTVRHVQRFATGGVDPFGRDFTTRPALKGPWCAVRVTGALFHTQGGLVVDEQARVLGTDGTALPNLFAGGGAARGVSGPAVDGYLSGNGLLTAATLGRIAGTAAARLVHSIT